MRVLLESILDVYTGFAILVVTMIYFYVQSYTSRKEKLLQRIGGPTRFPLIGNAWDLRTPTKVLTNMTKWERKYGPRFVFSFGTGLDVVSLSSPADLEKVMTSLDLIEKSEMYGYMKPWLGDGLLISTGKKWHERRKMLTPAFHFKILEQFQRVFDDKTKELVAVIDESIRSGEGVIEMHSLFTKCTLDIICETAMGKELNCLKEPENAFLKATLRESHLLWLRWASPWLRSELMWTLSPTGKEESANRKVLDDFTSKVIQERKRDFLKDRLDSADQGSHIQQPNDDENIYFSSKKKVAFLDLLLHHQATSSDGNALTDEGVREETATFMFEGHDTTASALTWALYLLGLHPEHQAQVIEELDEVFGDDTAREISSADLSKLKHLELCIKESLRLIPTVPLISRQATQDFKLDNGLIIPKGAPVMLNIYQVHHRPDLYPEPFEYRPERFSPENSLKRHPYAFIPFSAGPRNCIGQRFAMNEVKTTLVNILRNFTAHTVRPLIKDLKTEPEIVLRPHDGVHIQFKHRVTGSNAYSSSRSHSSADGSNRHKYSHPYS